ncbi:CTP synthase [Candidatus Cyrtobacter comes]|uniref:CTP synthase (glutamine hydrolyzing) n=1 Tax=Candidatus Cyrtobacter comes TaxID=675776 RepID=A0ABU5L8I5_9RICK|nr:CTP synthase [Candidatus Cyrtobacter comes]MDZ5762428.1 CTP synthase [Candidatus Cyrtobacter comes]
MTKFIFVTGGVISSLGKGVTSASVALLLKSMGYRVSIKKLDPYLNTDCGMMSPYQHGEVFITGDGGEVDMDFGHYERFTGNKSSKQDSITSGKVYKELFKNEAEGLYLGKTIQVVPHVTQIIKERVEAHTENLDILICEIGGTVGDIEALPYIEAARQIGYEKGVENVAYIHLTLLPFVKSAGEFKKKPTQHSVKELRSLGIQPTVLICRSESEVERDVLKKIAMSTSILEESVVLAPDLDSIYKIPMEYSRSNVVSQILKHLKLNSEERLPDLSRLEEFLFKMQNYKHTITIGLVGKYSALKDSYRSVLEAIVHAATHLSCKVYIKWLDLSEGCSFDNIDGFIIPGGFGNRGIQEKMMAIKFCRENNITCFCICLGMQLMVLEVANNVLGIDAVSSEFSDSGTFVVAPVDDENPLPKMKIGEHECIINPNSIAGSAYNKKTVMERHRHRYEINLEYEGLFSEIFLISGRAPCSNIEIIELRGHKWFLGTQFHPEFNSSFLSPHPLFSSFIKNILDKN